METTEQLSVRKLVSLTPALARAIDDYRFGQRIKSESEAIRALIRLGLDSAQPDKP